ncbi:MAG: coiled-coil domain-containing protein 30 [Cyanobacteria bacterium]|nr:coiled-coil domain-containing protein 30 [Cyanobacteriota bacterium]MDW8199857.1 hypothetical protein [Cyanobacteriota bacterium SKYGB_h_bin112]
MTLTSEQKGRESSMSQLLFHIPLLAGSVIVGGVVLAAGGSVFQSGIAGIAAGASGFATSALVTQSQVSRQKLVAQEHDRSELEIESQKSLLAFKDELERLQNLRELLQQSINELQQYKVSLEDNEDATSQLGETITDLDLDLDTDQNEEKPTEEKQQTESDTRVIVDFLASRNIRVRAVPAESPADHVINSLSKFLGENYSSLRQLLGKIKRSVNQGNSFLLSLKEYTQRDIGTVCQFCTRLHGIAFLEEYRYFRSPQYLIKAKAATIPEAHSFFSGKWLERFVLLAVKRCVEIAASELEQDIIFSYLLNPQIILPNGDDFELDLICCVNGSFFWIEAKSGDYQQHVSKYSKMSKMLNLDSKHSIMVLPDISEDRCAALTSLFSMTVCSLSHLEEVIIKAIRESTLSASS